jgi:CBS domain containing-hemolysin-like protein
MLYRIIIILILISLSAFFSASETALTGANRIRLKHRAEGDSRRARSAKKALQLIEKYDRMLATLLIGNNTVNLVAASIATVFAILISTPETESATVAAVTSILTLVLIIAGDILPKTLAREHADGFLVATARVLGVFMVLLSPVSAIMLHMQNGLSRVFRKQKREVSMTEQELLHIIDEIEDEGVLEEHESLLVRSALEFDETTVGEILTPRVDMTAVALTDSVEKVRDVFFKEGYSRLPVYDKNPDKVVGVISNKEFMKRLLSPEDFQIGDIMYDIPHIHALMKLSEALKLMQKEKSHLAVVLDQHGGTEGIVSLEDILEELVGEIWDEGDEEVQPVKFTGEHTFEVGSELSINDFNRSFEVYSDVENIEIDSESNTVGGWVFELFGKIPAVGESAESERFKITVLTMEGRRLGKLRFEMIGK